jgi:hypothetical protein
MWWDVNLSVGRVGCNTHRGIALIDCTFEIHPRVASVRPGSEHIVIVQAERRHQTLFLLAKTFAAATQNLLGCVLDFFWAHPRLLLVAATPPLLGEKLGERAFHKRLINLQNMVSIVVRGYTWCQQPHRKHTTSAISTPEAAATSNNF